MSDPSFLRIENLKKSYDGINALNGIDLSLDVGDFLTIFGPNGAGKTTLLKIIATLLEPSSGGVTMSDYDLEEHPEDFRNSVSVISHQSLLYNELTAKENLEFYADLYNIEKPAEKVTGLLKLVDLFERRNSKVFEFSRGMQQRLSIARALINDPSLILLDEPYSGLDQHSSLLLKNQLIKLHDDKRTIILVTHNLTFGMESATKVSILVKGRVAFFKKRAKIDDDKFDETYFKYVGGNQQWLDS
jgi:heme exporter protein A